MKSFGKAMPGAFQITCPKYLFLFKIALNPRQISKNIWKQRLKAVLA